MLNEGETETPIRLIRANYHHFERYGLSLSHAALREEYEEPSELIMNAGIMRSLIDLITEHQKEVNDAFKRE